MVRFLQLAAFEMQEEGVKRDMVGEDFPEAPLSHLRCQLSTRHALRVPFQGSLIKASPERGGEPPQVVEGFFVKSFSSCNRLMR